MTTAEEVEDLKNETLSSLDDKDLVSTLRTTFALAQVLDYAVEEADQDYELAYAISAKTVLTVLRDLQEEAISRGLV